MSDFKESKSHTENNQLVNFSWSAKTEVLTEQQWIESLKTWTTASHDTETRQTVWQNRDSTVESWWLKEHWLIDRCLQTWWMSKYVAAREEFLNPRGFFFCVLISYLLKAHHLRLPLMQISRQTKHKNSLDFIRQKELFHVLKGNKGMNCFLHWLKKKY